MAHGKHLFLEFDHGLLLHVHLGLYGAWDFGGDATFRGASSIGAPRKVGEREMYDDAWRPGRPRTRARPRRSVPVRVRLAGAHGWADLRGATTCEAITDAEAAAVVGATRAGPAAEPSGRTGTDASAATWRPSAQPLAALLMDQKVIAGVGNVYRAELLFRQRLNPWLPGNELSPDAARRLWATPRP